MAPRERLFVYGSLRPSSRYPMSRVLAHNARSLGRAAMRGEMASVGAYPAVRLDHSGGWVMGEVFEITGGRRVWRILDLYEGCHDQPPAYERRRIPVRLSVGRRCLWIAAWCYVMKASARDTG